MQADCIPLAQGDLRQQDDRVERMIKRQCGSDEALDHQRRAAVEQEGIPRCDSQQKTAGQQPNPGVSIYPSPQFPPTEGRGKSSNLLFRKAPSPLVGEGRGEGCERLR